jgi:hypothetical protein
MVFTTDTAEDITTVIAEEWRMRDTDRQGTTTFTGSGGTVSSIPVFLPTSKRGISTGKPVLQQGRTMFTPTKTEIFTEGIRAVSGSPYEIHGRQ